MWESHTILQENPRARQKWEQYPGRFLSEKTYESDWNPPENIRKFSGRNTASEIP